MNQEDKKKLQELQKRGERLEKCVMRMCKKEDALLQAAAKKAEANLPVNATMKQRVALVAKKKKSAEQMALLTCRYDKCKQDARADLENIVHMFRDNPVIYKKGMKLLQDDRATGAEYAKFLTYLK